MQERGAHLRITVETLVKTDMNKVWAAWNNSDDIKRWNAASDDWHTTRSSVDLREGGAFSARMEAKDGSVGFDFEGTYTRIVPGKIVEYELGDGRDVRSSSPKARAESSSGRRSRLSLRTIPSCSVEAGRPSWTISPSTLKRRSAPDK